MLTDVSYVDRVSADSKGIKVEQMHLIQVLKCSFLSVRFADISVYEQNSMFVL